MKHYTSDKFLSKFRMLSPLNKLWRQFLTKVSQSILTCSPRCNSQAKKLKHKCPLQLK